MRKITFIILLTGIVFRFQAQELISGVVSDEFGTLEGANILIKNSKKGAVSNSEGYFEVSTKKGDTVSISFIGYQTKEVVISNSKNINVTLNSNILLDEVIVNAYGTQKNIIKKYCCCSTYTTVSYFDNRNTNLITDRLYPNPSRSGVFQLSFVKNYNNIQIQINTISGQLIKISSHQNTNRKVNIDLSQFPTGIYLINIIADGKRLETKKAIRS